MQRALAALLALVACAAAEATAKDEHPDAPRLGARPGDPDLLDPDLATKVLSDPTQTQVVVFMDHQRRLGQQSVSLARGLATWFRSSQHQAIQSTELAASGASSSVPAEEGSLGGTSGARIRVMFGDCGVHPGLLSHFGLLALPAIRVFPAGVAGALALDVPFHEDARLDNFTAVIERIHHAATDVHMDMDGVVGPSGAILQHAATLTDLDSASDTDVNETNTTAAWAGVRDLSDAILARAEHARRLLLSRAKRLDMLTSAVKQVAAGQDKAALTSDLAATMDSLLERAVDEGAPGDDLLDSLMWASTLRGLLKARMAAEHASKSGPTPVDKFVRMLLQQ